MINVVISGGFDPVHIGHLRMMKEAKKLGDKLIVILNNDNFLMNKKGFAFMPQNERAEIIEGFDCVDEVFISIDQDSTVKESLKKLSENQKLNIFANGGDRKNEEDIPETKICKDLGIEMVFNVGGGKIQSSSELVKSEIEKPWGSYRTYEKSNGYLTKRISVNPKQRLSLQSHNHRAEFWIVTKGIAKVTCDDKDFILKKGEYIFIPLNSKHRLSNDENSLLEIVEIQFGEVLSEEDIIRYEDNYGRIT